MAREAATIESFIQAKYSKYYQLVQDLGFEQRIFKPTKNNIKLVVIPTDSEMGYFQDWKSIKDRADANKYGDRWRNHIIDVHRKQWISEEATVQGISKSWCEFQITRKLPLKLRSSEDESDTLTLALAEDKSQSVTVSIINKRLLFPNYKVLFCTVTQGKELPLAKRRYEFKHREREGMPKPEPKPKRGRSKSRGWEYKSRNRHESPQEEFFDFGDQFTDDSSDDNGSDYYMGGRGPNSDDSDSVDLIYEEFKPEQSDPDETSSVLEVFDNSKGAPAGDFNFDPDAMMDKLEKRKEHKIKKHFNHYALKRDRSWSASRQRHR